MSHLAILYEVGQHDDEVDSLLPHHAPEIVHCVALGSLGGDVGAGNLVTLPHGEHVNRAITQLMCNVANSIKQLPLKSAVFSGSTVLKKNLILTLIN